MMVINEDDSESESEEEEINNVVAVVGIADFEPEFEF